MGLVLGVFVSAISAQAKSLTWNGGGGNSYWNNTKNWGNQGVPPEQGIEHEQQRQTASLTKPEGL